MAEVPSTLTMKIGEKAPDFTLPNGSGNSFSLSDCTGAKGTLIFFTCNHCPFVLHLAKQIGEMAKEMKFWGVNAIAINSNDIKKYPEDSPEKMLGFAKKFGWDFPYLFDESQKVARHYYAACTPDFFLFEGNGNLYYSGQFDDSRPNNSLEIDGKDLKIAITSMIDGLPSERSVKPATGCNIKWLPGNEPDYLN